MTPVSTDMTRSIRREGMSCANIVVLLVVLFAVLVGSGQVQRDQQQIDQLDAHEGKQDATHAVDQHVSTKDSGGADRAVLDALEGQRYQRRDDQRVEDHCRQYGAVWCREL